MAVCTMPPESCTIQRAMPMAAITAETMMPTVAPLPPLAAGAEGALTAPAVETFSVISVSPLPYTR